ncbi:MAG TPA: Gldg family protein [Gallionella sp.]|nr:Gldg family protein [Gallionella sp.]
MLRNFFTSPPLRNLLFVLLLLGIASGLGYLATRYHVQRDITHNASNSLEPASVEVLRQLGGPVNITVYATEQDARLGDIRKIIRNFMSLYQRYKPDIQLTFIDPEKEPEKARAARVQLNGEMVVEYAGRSEHLTQLNEPTLTSTLLRLAHSRDQTVMYLDGHGERKLDGIANHDLGEPFGAKLRQNGFRIGSLNLALAQEVPRNTAVLVITQPQVDLMPGEVDKLLRHVERGGNLLWLVDAEPLHGLERLAEKLDLLLPPGTVIDPAASGMNAPATWSLGVVYPPHAITRNFNLITAFPSARPLAWNENPDWQHSVLVEVAARGWVSHNAASINTPGAKPHDENRLSGHPFDKQHDTPGPAIIAVALQRNINDREQRIVVVGNGAFLANSFAGNGGNVDLGVNMVNWLASEEHLITLQPRAAKDSNLALGKTQLTAIGIGFLLGLPLLLAGVGVYIWWKRRRA